MNILRKFVGLSLLLAAVSAAAQTKVVGLPAGRVDGDVEISGSATVGMTVLHGDGNEPYNLKRFGAKCDGSTDDTAALNAAFTAAYNAGGAEIVIPAATCLISGQVTLPNDGDDNFPKQPTISVRGLGAAVNGYWSDPVASVSTLDMRYDAPIAKIFTKGAGKLTITNLALVDGGTDCAPFIKTTNTTLDVHDNLFSGTTAGASACNDGVFLGGTTTTIGNGDDAAFQGYGSSVRHNWFHKIKRGVVGQTYANSTWIIRNIFSSASGNPTGAAIEFSSSASQSGNKIADNLVEAPYYKYSVLGDATFSQNQLSNNDLWDAGASSVASVRLEGTGNFVTCGYRTAGKACLSEATAGTNTMIGSVSEDGVQLPAPVIGMTGTSGKTAFQATENSSMPQWDIFNPVSNDESYVKQSNTGGNFTYALWFKVSGATAINPFTVKYYNAAGTYGILLNGTSNYIDATGGDLRIRFGGSSNLFLGSNAFVGPTGATTIQNSTAATSGANQSSPAFTWAGRYWNGSASATDNWSASQSLGTGTNPTSTLIFNHSGSSGAAVVSVPALRATGASGTGQSFACFDATGNLVRSDTACR